MQDCDDSIEAIFASGGTMGAFLRAVDWGATSLGEPETWPDDLRRALSDCLVARSPACLHWGPEQVLLYNEAWSPIPGDKHPWALGRTAREAWPEILALPAGREHPGKEPKSIEPTPAETGDLPEALLKNTTDLVYFKDKQSRFVRFSQAHLNRFLLNNSTDLKGKTDFDFYTEEHARSAFEDEQAIIHTGKPILNLEEKETHHDGRVTWVSTSKMPWHDQDGTIIGTWGISQDITELKHAQEEAALEQARLKFIFDSVPIGICLKMERRDGSTVRLINDAYLKISGITREQDQKGGPTLWESISHPEDQALQNLLSLQVEEGKIDRFSLDKRFVRPGGEVVWVMFSFQRRLCSDGSFEDLTTVVDISERKLAEAEREQLMRARLLILESTMEGIFGVDRQGCCTFMNRSATEMLGYKIEEVLGHEMHHLLLPRKSDGSPYPLTESPLHRTLGQGVPCHVDSDCFWRKNGTALSVDYSSSPIVEGGQVEGAVVAFSDLTEKKLLEARFSRAQRLESIGQLAAGIAHDLNNILAPIMLCTPLLREEVQSAGGVSRLNTVEACARRGADTVKQVLTFAKGQGGPHVRLQPGVALAEIVSFVRETFPKSITLAADLPGDLWTIFGDPTQLHQVLLNLAVNARDAMPQGGTLTIAARNVVVDEEEARKLPGCKAGPHLLLKISDTGEGIPKEVADRIFDPFFTTKGADKGTGLGLSTVIGIVKGHGGTIHFTSEPGRGTQFMVYLPASP